MKHTELIERLRGVVQKLRRTSMPIADVAPMVNEAADAIEALQTEVERLTLACNKAAQAELDLLAERDALKLDAERYRWLIDNRSYSYGMQPDSPAEHGIEYQWQQGTYEELNHGISTTIDAAIEAMNAQHDQST